MALQDGTQLQQIGQMLGGFGAGIQGNLPQYQSVQSNIQAREQEQKAKMMEARQKAIYTDANAGLQFAREGDYDSLIQLGLNRLQMLQQFGDADPSGTQSIIQTAIAAKNGSEEAQDVLMQDLESLTKTGMALGYLQAPEREKPATDIGKARLDLEQGYIDQDQYNKIVEQKSMENLGIVQAYPQDGEPMTLFRDGDKFKDLEGNVVDIDENTRIVEGSSLTGGVDEMGLTGSIQTRLINQQTAARNYMDSVADAIDMLQANPNINTLVGRGASIINDLQQEANALADTAGIDITEYVNSPSTEGTLDNLGIENNRMRSLITSLAFQSAMAVADSSGRAVSDKDYDRFLNEIGSSANDPRAFSQVLKDSAKRVDRGYRNFYKSARNGEEFEGDIGYSKIQNIENKAQDFTPVSAEGVSEGTTATGSNGKKIIVRDGMWVPL